MGVSLKTNRPGMFMELEVMVKDEATRTERYKQIHQYLLLKGHHDKARIFHHLKEQLDLSGNFDVLNTIMEVVSLNINLA